MIKICYVDYEIPQRMDKIWYIKNPRLDSMLSTCEYKNTERLKRMGGTIEDANRNREEARTAA